MGDLSYRQQQACPKKISISPQVKERTLGNCRFGTSAPAREPMPAATDGVLLVSDGLTKATPPLDKGQE